MGYNKNKFEKHNDFIDEFHSSRKAFIYYNGLHFLENSTMSHYEWYKSLGGESDEEFNGLIRGYYYKGDLVFYKADFVCDKDVELRALELVSEICETLKIRSCNVFGGLNLHTNEKLFPPDKLLGKWENGKLLR